MGANSHPNTCFGLELTNLINSNPSWKVAKGSRSASRRARKVAGKSLKNCAGLVSRNTEDFNMPVSESDKRGVSLSGCHFIEKVEHLPIKKRRFVLRSPSPPPSELPHPIIPSPPIEETADLTSCQNASVEPEALESASSDIKTSQNADNNISVNDNKSEKADERFGKGGDFSGISMLAAVACGSSLGRHCGYVEDGLCAEESLTQEQAGEVCTDTEVCSSSKGLLKEYLVDSSETYTGGNSSCIATEPAGELEPMTTPVSSSQKVATLESNKGASLGMGSSTFSEEVCNKDEEREGNPRLPFRNDRFHWDLNVVMDAWEHPLDYPEANNDVPYMSQDAGKIKDDDNTKSLDGHDSACGDQVSLLPAEPRALSYQSVEGTLENCDMVAYHNVAQTSSLGEKSLLSDCNNNMGVVNSVVKETKCVHDDETVKTTDGSVINVSDHVTPRPASGSMNEGESDTVKSLTFNENSHLTDRPIVEGLNSTATVSSPELENHRSAFEPDATFSNMQTTPCVSSTSDIQGEIVPNLASVDNLEKPELPCHQNVALEKVNLNATLDGKGLADSSCAEAPNSKSTPHELLVASDMTLKDAGNIQGEFSGQHDETIMNLSENSLVMSKGTCDPVCHDTSKANMDICLNSSDNVNNSQYEDGELRETGECAREAYDVDGEAEHVDYGSDMEICSTISADYCVPESRKVDDGNNGRAPAISDVSSIDNEFSRSSGKAIGKDGIPGEDDQWRLCHLAEEKMKAPRSREQLESSKRSSDVATRVGDENGRVKYEVDETRVESRLFRRGLHSQIEAPVACDVSSREEQLNKMESRYEELGSFRSFERGRYFFHNQSRVRQGDTWDDPSDTRRGTKRHHSPIIYGHSKLNDGFIRDRNDIGTQDNASYSHHRLPRNRPSGNEDAFASFQSHCRPDRRLTPERAPTFGRGRFFRRGPMDETKGGSGSYHCHPSQDENLQSSVNYARLLSRRERSLSPSEGRGHCGKSPFQSRSPSPIIWHSPNRRRPSLGGGTFLRQQSRSPNFRSEVRMQRLRSPHHHHQHQPGFEDDNGPGAFRSFSRRQGSPPQRRRWNPSNYRNDEQGHFRKFGYKPETSTSDRSPGRMRSWGRNPNGYNRYKECYEDRRKQHYGGPPHRPVRRSYEDDMASRLDQDIDDGNFSVGSGMIQNRDGTSFQGRGGRLRGNIDNCIGDLPRRFRGGEQQQQQQQQQQCFRYEHCDGRFNSNHFKQFVESEECRSSAHTGRFTENYEDRRKHYEKR